MNVLRWLWGTLARGGRWLIHRPWLCLLLVISLTIVGVVNRFDAEADERCRDNRDNRAVLRELVETATSPASAGGGDLTALTNADEFQALDPEDQEFWRLVFGLIAAPSTGSDGGQPDSTNARLIKFAKDRLTPIDCG